LFIIDEKGICIHNQNFVNRKIEPQLISGYLTALNDFSQEFMSQDLNTINLFSDKLVIYKEPATKLTIAALVNTLDNTSLIKSLLIKIINEFYELNKEFLKNESYNVKVKKNEKKLSNFVLDLLNNKTLTRDRSRTLISFFIACGILIGFLIGLTNMFVGLLTTDFLYIKNLFNGLPANFDPFNINFAAATFTIIGGLTTLFGRLISYLVGGLLISGLVFGYLSGTRKAAVRKGIVLMIIEIVTSCILLVIIDPGNYFLILFYLIFASTFIFVPLLSTSYIYYLGGILRERSKLYDIPEIQKIKKIDEMPDNF